MERARLGIRQVNAVLTKSEARKQAIEAKYQSTGNAANQEMPQEEKEELSEIAKEKKELAIYLRDAKEEITKL